MDSMADELAYTAEASPNIAFIKYWGRRSVQNLPNNSSLSMTLDSAVLSTKTSVLVSRRLDKDMLYINGELQDITSAAANEKTAHIRNILNTLRRLSHSDCRALIVSQNSFPADAGLASSASGSAAFIEAAIPAFGLSIDPKVKSMLAMQISGSACRSLFGGIVKWNVGNKPDGSDSYAEQVFDENYWPELLDIIAMVNDDKKKVSSSEGHTRTVKTSLLYERRVAFAEEGVNNA